MTFLARLQPWSIIRELTKPYLDVVCGSLHKQQHTTSVALSPLDIVGNRGHASPFIIAHPIGLLIVDYLVIQKSSIRNRILSFPLHACSEPILYSIFIFHFISCCCVNYRGHLKSKITGFVQLKRVCLASRRYPVRNRTWYLLF